MSLFEYMTKRTILRDESNQLKKYKKKHPNLKVEPHFGPWRSVTSQVHLRLKDVQWCIEFFTFPNKRCNFERFIKKLNTAITKIGRVFL